MLVGAADEPERPVELADLVQKDVQVERQGRRHAVLVVVGREVVVPLPDLAGEGWLGIDLGLLDVEILLTQNLSGRLDQPRVTRDLGVGLVPQVQAHGGAHLAIRLFAKVRGHLLGEKPGQRTAQRLDLGRREKLRQDQETVLVKVA